MKEVPCFYCKYGTTYIVFAEAIGSIIRNMRKCDRCGEKMTTYQYCDPSPPPGNMPPPKPPPMPEPIGDLRTSTGELLDPWEKQNG